MTLTPYLFDAVFDDGLRTEVQINPEFGSVDVARTVARKYATEARRIPIALRVDTGRVVANNVIAPIGNLGTACIHASARTDVVVDVSGWFEPGAEGRFMALSPTRIIDTRNGTGIHAQPGN